MKIRSWGTVRLDKTGMKKLMRAAGGEVARKTRRLIAQSTGSGRTYRGGGGAGYRGGYRAGHYRASAPGSPPVRVTGTLYRSIRTYPYRSGDGFAVRARAVHASFLEIGATGGGNPGRRAIAARGGRRRTARRYTVRRLEPRPFLGRVMREEQARLERRLHAAFEVGLSWRETKGTA